MFVVKGSHVGMILVIFNVLSFVCCVKTPMLGLFLAIFMM